MNIKTLYFHREAETPGTGGASLTQSRRRMVRVGEPREMSAVKAITLTENDAGIPVVVVLGHDQRSFEYPLSSVESWEPVKRGRPAKGASK